MIETLPVEPDAKEPHPNQTSKRNLLNQLNNARFICTPPKGTLLSAAGEFVDINQGAASRADEFVELSYALTIHPMEKEPNKTHPGARLTFLPPGKVVYSNHYCLANVVAHEAYHSVVRRIPRWIVGTSSTDFGMFGNFESPGDGVKPVDGEWTKSQEEDIVNPAIDQCIPYN